jgi:putative DNA primase/helicase
LQVALGYSITGRVNEKAVFVWWGKKGDNGKSTLMNLLKLILGNYCKSASKCLFIKSKSDSKLTPECEVLKDTRLAVFSKMSAYSKLLIASNHKPAINISDSAMVRQVKFIPFLAKLSRIRMNHMRGSEMFS